MFSNIKEIRYLKGVGEKRAELLKKLGSRSPTPQASRRPHTATPSLPQGEEYTTATADRL